MFIDKNKTAQKVFNLIYYYYEIRRNQIKREFNKQVQIYLISS